MGFLRSTRAYLKTLSWALGVGCVLSAISWLTLQVTGMLPYLQGQNALDYTFKAPQVTIVPEGETTLLRCKASALTGSALLLTCDNHSSVATLASIATPPVSSEFGKAARESMNTAISLHGGALEACSPVHSRYVCTAGRLDLRLVLLEAGLAIVWPRSADAMTGNAALVAAENRAKLGRLGIWFDWNGKTNFDPIVRRIAVDQGVAEQAQAYRAQAVLSLFSAAFTGFLAFLGGWLLSSHEKTTRLVQLEDYLAKQIGNGQNEIEKMLYRLSGMCSAGRTTLPDLKQGLADVESKVMRVGKLLDEAESKGELSPASITTWRYDYKKSEEVWNSVKRSIESVKPDDQEQLRLAKAEVQAHIEEYRSSRRGHE